MCHWRPDQFLCRTSAGTKTSILLSLCVTDLLINCINFNYQSKDLTINLNPVGGFSCSRAQSQPSSSTPPTWSVPRYSLRAASRISFMWPRWPVSTRITRAQRGGSPPEPLRACLTVDETCPLSYQPTTIRPKLRPVLSCKHKYTLPEELSEVI